MAKYVMGAFATVKDAKAQVDELMRQGYPAQSISVMADQTIVTNLGDLGVAVEDDYTYQVADETTWHRIKDFFGGHDRDNYALYGHQRELRDGKVLLLVDCEQVPETLQGTAQNSDKDYWNLAKGKLNEKDEDVIRLQEERLKVDKQDVATGEVTLKKRVVQETQTIDVPVEREELVIERRPASGKGNAKEFADDTITIPLSEQQVRVTKEPVVTEEVHVKKRETTDTKQVSETVRKEQLDVNKAGNVVVENMPGQNVSAPPM